MQTMRDMILSNKDAISAIGECGLDYSNGFPDKSIQIPCFEEHLKLSSELKMPLYIHQRGAFKDFVVLMDKYRDHLDGIPVLVHCFTGSKDELEWILERPNFFISVSGFICKPKHGSELRKLLSNQRYQQDYDLLNRIMIETDAPYLGFPSAVRILVEMPKVEGSSILMCQRLCRSSRKLLANVWVSSKKL